MTALSISLERFGLVNTTTTANEPAIIALFRIGTAPPVLSVGSSGCSADVVITPSAARELVQALSKLLEVAS